MDEVIDDLLAQPVVSPNRLIEALKAKDDKESHQAAKLIWELLADNSELRRALAAARGLAK
jgi:hypothetical protein